jgi:sec-independent protein translocase protein TatA
MIWLTRSSCHPVSRSVCQETNRPFHLGGTELIIILVIVILLFGVNRIGKIGGELGKGIREFRAGIKGDGDAGKE